MDILFIIDRLELKYFEFNNLVTNFWIIRELLRENKNVFIKLTKTRDNKSFKYDIIFDKNDCVSKTNVYIANTSYTIAFSCFLAGYFIMKK